MENLEYVGKCKICGKLHYRENAYLWYYHSFVGVVCRHHVGVKEWYQELINKTAKVLYINDNVEDTIKNSNYENVSKES